LEEIETNAPLLLNHFDFKTHSVNNVKKYLI
jgi:hypothetical protein